MQKQYLIPFEKDAVVIRALSVGACINTVMNALLILVSTKYVVPLMFAPALVSYLSSYLIEPVFRRYEDAQRPDTEESED